MLTSKRLGGFPENSWSSWWIKYDSESSPEFWWRNITFTIVKDGFSAHPRDKRVTFGLLLHLFSLENGTRPRLGRRHVTNDVTFGSALNGHPMCGLLPQSSPNVVCHLSYLQQGPRITSVVRRHAGGTWSRNRWCLRSHDYPYTAMVKVKVGSDLPIQVKLAKLCRNLYKKNPINLPCKITVL